MNNKRIAITLIANIIAFLANSLIGFFITPLIIERVGVEANGFVSLANNFTNYANIFMIALNSMAGRFITIEFSKKNFKEANEYFNSVLLANIIMTVILAFPALIFVLFADNLINISPKMVADVKVLFAFIFAAFFVKLLGASFSCSTFAANRKDLEATRQIESYVIKVITLVGCFSFFKPHIYYVGLSIFLMGAYVCIRNMQYTKELTPELKINQKYYSAKKLSTLLKSGIWNSINHLSQALLTGTDILITNLWLGGTAMGMLSIAKLLPGIVDMFICQLAAIFFPEHTIAYAKSDKARMSKSIRNAIVITSIFSNICMSVIWASGKNFYKIWIPSQNADQLHILTILTMSSLFLSAGVYCIYNLPIVANKICIPALVRIGASIINIASILLVVNNSSYGLYAVVGINAVISAILTVVFYIPYAAKSVNEESSTFYKQMFVNTITVIITILTITTTKSIFTINGWKDLILCVLLQVFLALIINILICTNKKEKLQAISFFKNNILRKFIK